VRAGEGDVAATVPPTIVTIASGSTRVGATVRSAASAAAARAARST
jgi:hypothetical protein